jgi:hypothetical protein
VLFVFRRLLFKRKELTPREMALEPFERERGRERGRGREGERKRKVIWLSFPQFLSKKFEKNTILTARSARSFCAYFQGETRLKNHMGGILLYIVGGAAGHRRRPAAPPTAAAPRGGCAARRLRRQAGAGGACGADRRGPSARQRPAFLPAAQRRARRGRILQKEKRGNKSPVQVVLSGHLMTY